MSKQRIDWVDAAKGVGILLVMFGHNWLSNSWTYWLTAFHMPLFFILSGYTFSTRRPFGEFLVVKSKTLLIPYIVFAMFYILFYTLLSKSHGGDFDVLNELKQFLLQQRHTYLWFLPVLFLSSLLCYGYVSLGDIGKWLMGGVMLTFYHILYVMGLTNMLWNVDLVPLCTFFIICGYEYRKLVNSLCYEGHPLYIAVVAVVAVVASTFNYERIGYKVDMWGNSFGNFPLFYTGAIMGAYMVILLLKSFPTMRGLVWIGANSIVLYGFHRMVIELLFVIEKKMLLPFDGHSLISGVTAVANVAMATIVLVPVCIVINKKTPWMLGKF